MTSLAEAMFYLAPAVAYVTAAVIIGMLTYAIFLMILFAVRSTRNTGNISTNDCEEDDTETHVIPTSNVTREHVTSGEPCWCHPGKNEYGWIVHRDRSRAIS